MGPGRRGAFRPWSGEGRPCPPQRPDRLPDRAFGGGEAVQQGRMGGHARASPRPVWRSIRAAAAFWRPAFPAPSLTVPWLTLKEGDHQETLENGPLLSSPVKNMVTLTLTAQSRCRKRLRHRRCNACLAQPNRGVRVRKSGTQMSQCARYGARTKA
jgi:hypothetical protein